MTWSLTFQPIASIYSICTIGTILMDSISYSKVGIQLFSQWWPIIFTKILVKFSRIVQVSSYLVLLTEQFAYNDPGKDETGIGHWLVMTQRGKNGVQTRVACGYNPCYKNNPNSSTFYQHHCRFFIAQRGDLSCTCCNDHLHVCRESGKPHNLMVHLHADPNSYNK
jgi:hypothetical protein